MQTLFIVAALIGAVSIVAWYFWPKIKGLFGDSETIFVARLHTVIGVAWWALLNVDAVVPLLNIGGYGKVASVIVIVQGVIIELARRSRATDV